MTIEPVTTNTARVYDFQVLLPAQQTGLPRDGKAQAEQVCSISVSRIAGVAGWVQAEQMGALDEALRLHLAL